MIYHSTSPTPRFQLSSSDMHRPLVATLLMSQLMFQVYRDHCLKLVPQRELRPARAVPNEMKPHRGPSRCDRGSHGQGPTPILPTDPINNPSKCSRES